MDLYGVSFKHIQEEYAALHTIKGEAIKQVLAYKHIYMLLMRLQEIRALMIVCI